MKKILNRNEMAIAPAPLVRRAIRNFDVSNTPYYFDGYYGSKLAPVIAKKFKLPEQQVSVGYGAEFFLKTIFDSCDPKRDAVLTSAIHYSFYSVYAKEHKLRLVEFNIVDCGARFEFDIDDCVRKIKSLRLKVVLITSPNNPTGNSISAGDLEKILRVATSGTLVVLDQAYWGFDPKYNEHAFLLLLKRYGNLVLLRSFSKYYALAGLRLGFTLWGSRAKKLIGFTDFYLGGNRLLEEIGIAALKSESYYRKIAHQLINHRSTFISTVNHSSSFKAYQSGANFVLIKIIGDAKRQHATRIRLEKELAKLPVAISKFITPNLIRVSLGSPKHTPLFILALKKVDER